MLHRHAMVWERDQPWAVLEFEENPGAVFEFGVNLGAGPVVDLLSSSEMFILQGVFCSHSMIFLLAVVGTAKSHEESS